MNSKAQASGTLTTKVMPRYPSTDLSIEQLDSLSKPSLSVPEIVSEWRISNRENFDRGFDMVRSARKHNIPHFYGRLWVSHFPKDEDTIHYGLASLRVVTTAGVDYIVRCFRGDAAEPENMKYHGIGTDNTTEDISDTALQSELSTQYDPENLRDDGDQTTGATDNIYRTVGVNQVKAGVAIVEHGIFDQAGIGGGTLLDRSVFATITLANGDSLQTTYDLTFSSGG